MNTYYFTGIFYRAFCKSPQSMEPKEVFTAGSMGYGRGGNAAGWDPVASAQLFLQFSNALTTCCSLIGFVHFYFLLVDAVYTQTMTSESVKRQLISHLKFSWHSVVRPSLFPRPSRKQTQFLRENSLVQKMMAFFLLLVGFHCGSSS